MTKNPREHPKCLKFKSVSNNVKAETATDCAKHANVKAEVATGKAEAATGCAKHANVKAEVATGKAEVAARKAEVVTGKT